jgi:hypothetical protein
MPLVPNPPDGCALHARSGTIAQKMFGAAREIAGEKRLNFAPESS